MLTLKQLKNLIIEVAGKHAVYVQGPPGCGKSETIASIVEDLGMNYFADVRLGTRDAQELKGILIPDVKNKRTIPTRPDFFPPEELGDKAYGILFLDEFDHAAPTVQSAAYQLILDRKIGEYKLPDNVWIVLASNSKEDGGVHFQIKRPIKNRMIQVKAKASVDEWIEEMGKRGIYQGIISFIKQNPHMLYHVSDVNGTLQDDLGSFATPRSWSMVNNLLTLDIDEITFTEALNGTIGVSAASHFIKFLEIVDTSIDLDEILKNKLSGIDESDLRNTIALYYILDCILNQIENGGISKKSRNVGILNFINMLPEPSMKFVFYSKIVQAAPQILTAKTDEEKATLDAILNSLKEFETSNRLD